MDENAGRNLLKPPSEQAIERALRILLDSVEDENSDANSSLPTGCSTTALLDKLQWQCRALQISHAALYFGSRARMARLGRQRNSLVPINKLPFEITADILLQSILPEDHEDLTRLHCLACVQSPWWNIIRTSPSFWTTIHTGEPEILRVKLRKSGALPLDLVFEGWVEPNHQKAVLLALERDRHRFRSLENSWKSVSQEFLLRPLPRLERLVLAPIMGSHTYPAFDFPGGPQLRYLELARATLRWERCAELSQLKTLKIRGCPMNTPEPFINALGLCSQLHTLDFGTVRSPVASAAVTIPTTLPSLRTLLIREVGQALTVSLITSIRAENLEELVIHHGQSSQPCEETIRRLLAPEQQPPILGPLLRLPDLLSIGIEVNSVHIKVKGHYGGRRGRFSINAVQPTDWLEDLGRMPQLCLSTLTRAPIHLSILDVFGDEEIGAVNLSALNTVSSIRLGCGPRLALAVINALSTSHVPHGAALAQWPCPLLKRIYIEEKLVCRVNWEAGDDEWEALVNAFATLVDERNAAEETAELTLYYCRAGRSDRLVQDVRSLFADEGIDDDTDSDDSDVIAP